jgi:hypothetical protein
VNTSNSNLQSHLSKAEILDLSDGQNLQLEVDYQFKQKKLVNVNKSEIFALLNIFFTFF